MGDTTAFAPGSGASVLPAHGRADLSEVGDWIALLKPRVVSLVVFSGLVGLLLAPGRLHPVLAATAMMAGESKLAGSTGVASLLLAALPAASAERADT